jgi:hypothetical protein
MKKVNICRFGSGKWFFSSKFAQFAEVGKNRSKSCAPAREEYNKYDLTAAPCFLLVNHNDWLRWFAISVPHLLQSLFQSYGWGCKKGK